jgi:hypothetical protein
MGHKGLERQMRAGVLEVARINPTDTVLLFTYRMYK